MTVSRAVAFVISVNVRENCRLSAARDAVVVIIATGARDGRLYAIFRFADGDGRPHEWQARAMLYRVKVGDQGIQESSGRNQYEKADQRTTFLDRIGQLTQFSAVNHARDEILAMANRMD